MRNRFTLVALLLAGVLAAPVLMADEQCSLRSLAGDWGYTVTGTRLPVGPAASVGWFHLDRHGNLAGTQTLSLNGTIVQGEVLTGTVTVNSDCTGSSVIVVSNTPFPRTSNLDLVWTNSSRKMHAMFTNAGTILTVDGERIHHGDDD